MFFFVKQKTAYEMRISDWSSDVCSSDLRAGGGDAGPQRSHPGLNHAQAKALRACRIDRDPGFALPLVGIFGDELHIHERRFSGLVEMLAGDHWVIQIEYVTVLIGAGISCLSIASGSAPIARSPQS